jgi:hypothetical protein
MGLRRQPIDYLHADGAIDAMKQAASYDTRYLAVATDQPAVPLPPDRSFLPQRTIRNRKRRAPDTARASRFGG